MLSSAGVYGQWAVHVNTSRIPEYRLEEMEVGTYWSVRNTRLKVRSGGAIEMDMYAAKLFELDPEKPTPLLKELLK
jgi:hypothetical protein